MLLTDYWAGFYVALTLKRLYGYFADGGKPQVLLRTLLQTRRVQGNIHYYPVGYIDINTGIIPSGHKDVC